MHRNEITAKRTCHCEESATKQFPGFSTVPVRARLLRRGLLAMTAFEEIMLSIDVQIINDTRLEGEL